MRSSPAEAPLNKTPRFRPGPGLSAGSNLATLPCMSHSRVTVTIPGRLAGTRLDRALAELLPDYSRARIQSWLRDDLAIIDGAPASDRTKVAGGELVSLTPTEAEPLAWQKAPIPIDVVMADEHLLVIDKPAGLVVHPGAGHRNETLANGLLHRYPELATVPRAGIVHRLDKDTSGLLLVARTELAHRRLTTALKARTVKRSYQALVLGPVARAGCVEAPIGRHPVRRTRMAVRSGGRQATTHYRVINSFAAHTHLSLELETGRTHQIRVHMAHIGHPILGDPTYGGRAGRREATAQPALAAFGSLRRQALHACRLALAHPASGERIEIRSRLPEDIRDLLAALEAG